jgi:hypothetical protein
MTKQEMYVTKSGERRYQIAAPVSEETYSALRELAYEEATTLAAQVRKAADEYVARRRPASRRIG